MTTTMPHKITALDLWKECLRLSRTLPHSVNPQVHGSCVNKQGAWRCMISQAVFNLTQIELASVINLSGFVKGPGLDNAFYDAGYEMTKEAYVIGWALQQVADGLPYNGPNSGAKDRRVPTWGSVESKILDLAPTPTRVELAKSVLALVNGEIEGQKWDQRQWAMWDSGDSTRLEPSIDYRYYAPEGTEAKTLPCASSFCVAGWVAHEAGAMPTSLPHNEAVYFSWEYVVPPGDELGIWDSITSAEYAAQLLELDEDAREWLFDACRSELEVRHALQVLMTTPEAPEGGFDAEDIRS